MQKQSHLKLLINYQQQLKATIQSTDNLILQNKPQHQQNLQQLIAQQCQLIKYIQIESSHLTPQANIIYKRNIVRLKNKIDTHKQYIYTFFGASPLKKIEPTKYKNMHLQQGNIQLINNKMTMYQNQNIHEDMNRQLNRQGQVINNNIIKNKSIHDQIQTSQTYIHFIQRSIMKRKLMFLSLVLLFLIAVVIVVISKIKK